MRELRGSEITTVSGGVINGGYGPLGAVLWDKNGSCEGTYVGSTPTSNVFTNECSGGVTVYGVDNSTLTPGSSIGQTASEGFGECVSENLGSNMLTGMATGAAYSGVIGGIAGAVGVPGIGFWAGVAAGAVSGAIGGAFTGGLGTLVQCALDGE